MEDSSDISGGDLITLPLFPLNAVLFPGMALPLHIFGERCKAMIGGCASRQEPFGAVLIKEGQDAAAPSRTPSAQKRS